MGRQCGMTFRLIQVTLLFITQRVDGSMSWAVTPVDTIAKEGQVTTLFCKVNTDGEQHPVILWIMDPKQSGRIVAQKGVSFDECCDVTGEISSGESNLLIKYTTKSHNGEWQCLAAGLGESGKKNARITVIGSNEPSFRKKGIGPRNEVIVGSSITLGCKTESTLPSSAKLVLMRDNKNVREVHHNQLSHTVSVEIQDHGANFSCKLEHGDTSFFGRDIVTLDVQYSPVAKVQPYLCVTDGTHQTLDCEYTPGNPSDTQVKWKAPNDETATRDNPLIIDNIDEHSNNLHNYTCIVTNTFFDGSEGRHDGITMVQFEHKPSVSTPTLYEINEGQDLKLYCNVKSIAQAIDIKWTAPDSSVYPSQILTVLNVTRIHRGVYSCHATNKLCDDVGWNLNSSSSSNVTINFKPTAANLSKHTSERYGKFVNLTCSTDCSNPAAEVNWYVNGIMVDGIMDNITFEDVIETECENGGFTTSQQLSILMLPGDNDVHIKCSTQNPNFTEDEVFSNEEIIVATFPPRLPDGCKTRINISGTKGNTTNSIPEGTYVTFKCTSCSSKPTAAIHWYLGNKPLLSPANQSEHISVGVYGGNVTEHSITIKSLKREKGENIHCKAVNELFPGSPSSSENITLHVVDSSTATTLKSASLSTVTSSTHKSSVLNGILDKAEWRSDADGTAIIISVIVIILLVVVVILAVIIIGKHRKYTQIWRTPKRTDKPDGCILMAVRGQPITRTHESDNDDSIQSGSPHALYSTPNKGRKQKHTASDRKHIQYHKNVPTCGIDEKEPPFLANEKQQGRGRSFNACRVWPDESSDSSTTDCDDGSYELLNEPLPPRRYEPQYENTRHYPGNIRVNSKEEEVPKINSPTVRPVPVLDYKRRNRPAKVREYENIKRNDNIDRSEEASGGVRKQVEPNVENLVYAQLDLSTKTKPPKKSAKGRDERSDYSTIDHLRTENLRRERKNAAADV